MSPFLLEIADAARAAGRDILSLYKAGCAEQTKADGSPVTEADLRAEAIITAALARIAPDLAVVSEEAAAAGQRPKCGDRFFLVDALDGTKEFLRGETGEFTVNVALISHCRPAAGVVYAPVTGALYIGGEEGAAKAECDPKSDAPAIFAPIQVAQRAAGFRIMLSRRSPELKAFLANIDYVEKIWMSSSLKFCWLASGEADLYPRFGPMHGWDAAAGHAVLAAAGGGALDLDGSPILYEATGAPQMIPGFVAYGGESAREAAEKSLALLREAAPPA